MNINVRDYSRFWFAYHLSLAGFRRRTASSVLRTEVQRQRNRAGPRDDPHDLRLSGVPTQGRSSGGVRHVWLRLQGPQYRQQNRWVSLENSMFTSNEIARACFRWLKIYFVVEEIARRGSDLPLVYYVWQVACSAIKWLEFYMGLLEVWSEINICNLLYIKTYEESNVVGFFDMR